MREDVDNICYLKISKQLNCDWLSNLISTWGTETIGCGPPKASRDQESNDHDQDPSKIKTAFDKICGIY